MSGRITRRFRSAATVVAVAGMALGGLALPAEAASTPVNGKACTSKGKVVRQQAQNGFKEWTCIKLGARLVWKVTGWPDLGAQPLPVDGAWLVGPGMPKDLPPMMWQGEPAWFSWNWDIPTAQSVGTCSSETPLTTYLTNPAALESITPQGFTQPGFHALPVPHMYYQTGGPVEAGFASERVDVVAPADMTLRGVATNNQGSYKEYMLSFSICGKLWLFLAHMDNLSAPIRNAMKNAPMTDNGNTCRWPDNCTYIFMSLRLKAGDAIGRSSGRSGGFDVGLADMSGTAFDPLTPAAKRLNPSAFSPRWTASRCHIAYYAAAAKRAVLNDLLDGDNGCGQLVSDRKGTAAGVWLSSDTHLPSSREDYHVGLIRDASSHAQQDFTIGNDAGVTGLSGVNGGVFVFTPDLAAKTGPNRSFYDVGLNEVVCYDALSARQGGSADVPTVYIRVTTVNATTERLTIGTRPVGTACGSGPWSMPAGARTFRRGTSMAK